MHFPSVLMLILLLSAVACKPAVPAAEQPAAAPASVTEPAAAPASKNDFAFIKEMPYATLRKRLTDAGWFPLRDPMCSENVGGEARVCRTLPEVESCSGDGYCVMHFASADEGKRMRVTTYGSSDRWDVPGEEAALAVKSWDVSALLITTKSADSAAAGCPSRDFDSFLKAFASDDRIERAFTTPLVKVAELYSDDTGDHVRMVYMAGAGYDGFNVNHAGNAFHFVDSEGKVDTSPLALEVSQVSESVRDVRYLYGMSEGNSYRFEEKGDCWYLSEDPEAPSP